MAAADHTIYPNAPAALVAVEIRFPGEVGTPVSEATRLAFREVLGEGWINEQVQQTVTFNMGAGGPGPLLPAMIGGPGGLPPGALLRFAVRDRTTAVALTAGSVTVETTAYRNWPHFRSILEQTIMATAGSLHPDGVVRVGIRYIDEIRVDSVSDGSEWVGWLSPTVLPPAVTAMTEAGHPPVNWTGAAQYVIGEERNLVLRYGPQPAVPGFAVNPDGPLLRRGQRPAGAFFLLDFDAFWQPLSIPEWDNASLLSTCDELYEPVRALFGHIVTERLITEVFEQGEKTT